MPGSSTVTVFGLGGVGKTALALSFAHAALEAGTYAAGVYWLAASGEPARAMSTLAPILREHAPSSIGGHIPTAPQTPNDLAESVRVALGRAPHPLLLVLDDVDAPDWQALLPGSTNVHVVITTRDRRFAQGSELHLDVLGREEALQLAGLIAGNPPDDKEAQALDRVVNSLFGGIPLAVEMAAKSVLRWSISWSRYEQMLEKECVPVLESSELGTHYPRGVFGAIELSIDRCPADSAELRLLRAIAVFAPAPVASAWVFTVANLDPSSFEAARAVGVLTGLALISAAEDGSIFAVHRLVHRWVRLQHAPTASETRSAVEVVDDWIGARVDPQFRAEVEVNEPHILETLTRAGDIGEDAAWIEIGRSMVSHLRFRGAYAESLALVMRVLAHAETFASPDARLIADLKADVGVGHLDILEPEAALRRLCEALKVHEELLGPNHLQVAVTRTNIGLALLQLNRPDEAEAQFLAAFEIDRKNLPSWNPNRDKFLGNLGTALRKTGHAHEGLLMLEAAAYLAAQIHSPNHPEVPLALNNLAGAYLDEGRTEDAVSVLENALKLMLAGYGESHPVSCLTLSNLSVARGQKGEANESTDLARRALDIATEVHGHHHPETARCVSNLGVALRQLGEPESAVSMLERALEMLSARAAREDSLAITVRVNLAGALHKLAESTPPVGALTLLERALALLERTNEPFQLAIVQVSRAVVLCRLGRLIEARQSFDLARPVLQERSVPPVKASVLWSQFGGAHEESGHLSQARELFQVAIDREQAEADANAPGIALDRLNLARVLRKEGRETAAREQVAAAAASLERATGRSDELLGTALGALAEAQADLGDFEAALSASERSFSILEGVCGLGDPSTTAGLLQRIDILEAMGRFHEALPLHEDFLLRITERAEPEYVELRLGALRRQAGALMRAGEHDRSLAILEQRLRLLQTEGADRLLVAETYQLMGQVHRSSRHFTQALEMASRAHASLGECFAEGSVELAVSFCNLALAQKEAGLIREAQDTIDRACAEAARLLPLAHPLRRWFQGTRDLVRAVDLGDNCPGAEGDAD